jgi:hypothetical protein
MTRPDPAGAAGRGLRALRTTDWKAKAKQAAATLKAEYEAGKQGDDSPAEQIWPSASEQFDGVVSLLRTARSSASSKTAGELDAEASDVAVALRGVDWSGVKAATSEHTSGARRAMREMADQVDWAKVQPVAAQVSSALIAAVASGQIPMGGMLGSTVVRTIVNQGGLAQKVADSINDHNTPLPPDFRSVIDTTARDT